MNQTEQATRTDASIVYELLVLIQHKDSDAFDAQRFVALTLQWRNQYRTGTDS